MDLSYSSCIPLRSGAAQEFLERPQSRRVSPRAYELQDADSSACVSGSGVFAGGGPLIFGGGGGALFAAGAESSSLLFCSPSLKYSSNAEFGDAGFLAFRIVLGGPEGVDPIGGGGGEANVAGTSKSLDWAFDVV